MRIFNRAHFPWFVFVIVATLFAIWLYAGNFAPENLPSGFGLPARFIQKPSEHRSVGGTPLGLIFGTISLAIFIFAALLGIRKRVVLWRIGNVQRWLRAHIWLTLLTIPLVILHSGFRFGGPMTILLLILYAIVMVSGIYGLALQHRLPRIMKERLPAETVYEQIPHIRAQLQAAAEKMRDSFKPAPPAKPDAGAPSGSAAKVVTAGSTPMASTASELSTPAARAKTVVGSTITAETVNPRMQAAIERAMAARAAAASSASAPATSAPNNVASQSPAVAAEKPPAPAQTSAAQSSAQAVASPPKPAAPPPAAPKPVAAAPTTDPASEEVLVEFLQQQILPYLKAQRGDRMPIAKTRYAEDLFRFVKLRVAPVYLTRVEEIQAWCDERRMLDVQVRLQHWLHGWLFVHAPVSFLLIMLTVWHAWVTLFRY
jgi:hypothetical protein